jgi:hypothetical protein
MKRLAMGTALMLVTTSATWAQAPAANEPPQTTTPVPAQAQSSPPPAQPGPQGMPMMNMMGMMGMIDHVEGRIAFLKAELKITEAQMPQWNAFIEALRANARRMSGMPALMMQGGMVGQDGASVSAPDRLDRMEKMMTTMLETIKAMKAALAPLYVAFTDEQKKAADQLIRAPMGMGPI